MANGIVLGDCTKFAIDTGAESGSSEDTGKHGTEFDAHGIAC